MILSPTTMSVSIRCSIDYRNLKKDTYDEHFLMKLVGRKIGIIARMQLFSSLML